MSLGWGRTESSTTGRGELYLPAVAAALGPSLILNGTPRCSVDGTAAGVIEGCVPLDLFGGPGSITPAQLSGLTYTGRSRGLDELWSLQANAGGELFRIGSGRPAGFAAGYEYRDLSGLFVHDPITKGRLTTRVPLPDTRGGYRVNELHGELSIPIVSGAPGTQQLEASAAARWSHYSTFGSDTSYLLGALWRPAPDVTLRATYSRAFRAPDLQESFRAREEEFPALRDPCRGPSAGGPPVSQACLEAGVPFEGTGDLSGHQRANTGGDPGVGLETAKVYTLGIVLEPRWVRNLTVTAGYHAIEIDGTIGNRGARVLLEGCYSGANPEYCGQIVRDPVTLFIDGIYDLSANAGKLVTAGLDLAVRYGLPTRRAGRLDLGLDATWLQKVDQTLPDGTVIHGKGTFDLNALNSSGGAGGTFPAWKANAAVTWQRGGLAAGISTRFIGSFHECGVPNGAGGADFSGAGLCYVDSRFRREVAAWHAESLFVSYALRTRAGRTSLTLGVQNLGDAPPAEIYNGASSATDPYSYDPLGRFYYVRVGQAYSSAVVPREARPLGVLGGRRRWRA